MSNITFLEKLLDGAEVEYKPLGELIKLEKGKQLNKEFLTETGLYPAYNGGISYSGFTDKYNYDKNKTIISQGGASAGFVNFITKRFYANAHCYVVLANEKIVENRYTYHFLKMNQKNLVNKKHGAGIPALNANNLKNLEIPIPCPENPEKSLKIQAEIVRILDTFTALTTELTTELTARKKQYKYFLDKLLTFSDNEVEYKLLGEIAKVQRGASPRPISKYITDNKDGISWIKIGDTSTGSKYVQKTKQKITFEGAKKSRLLKKGDFIISNSMSFGRPYILNIDGAIHDGWASISEFDESLKSDFLYYYLSSKLVQNYWLSKINSGSVSNLNADIIKTLKIPIPPIEQQQRIVDILDKFNTLVNDISDGLPAEIKARQQQYEYYRDQLFNFPQQKDTK